MVDFLWFSWIGKYTVRAMDAMGNAGGFLEDFTPEIFHSKMSPQPYIFIGAMLNFGCSKSRVFPGVLKKW